MATDPLSAGEPMRVLETVAEVRDALSDAPRPVGVVLTMGFLHEGHLALVRRARAENATVAASIFVNPTQFGPTEDLSAYPRDLQRDLSLLRQEGVDVVFTPTPGEVYPPDFDTSVHVSNLAQRLEGEHRPGHLTGVCTVVLKLLNILSADRTYFGQKDAQQVLVVRRMVRDLDLPVEVVAAPTVREPDGLAMSSRNAYLKSDERRAALVLSRALGLARARFNTGERDASATRAAMGACIEAEPLARADYVSVADADTLEELETLDRPALVSLAVHIGGTRLLDNILLP
jgi:pantoate--beta-alanine ligase